MKQNSPQQTSSLPFIHQNKIGEYAMEHTHAKHTKHTPTGLVSRGLIWLLGVGSIIWLLLRSGCNPRRLSYPCQRAAAANSLAFLAYLGSLLGLTQLRRFFSQRKAAFSSVTSLAPIAMLAALLTNSQPPMAPASAEVAALPGWTSASAVSNVFAVENVPVPTCSLDGGTLPASGPCHTPSVALADDGVDQ